MGRESEVKIEHIELRPHIDDRHNKGGGHYSRLIHVVQITVDVDHGHKKTNNSHFKSNNLDTPTMFNSNAPL